ncbi:sulfotransferase family protein [Acrocarpospora phusangensis]|uniref:Sulfotransferase family protein n=1 Tax=Acrocarpospora phusangensis TaxID=1070424 RepID=A0A919QDU3_9ACTN|nr:sulfotransferase [Acrocarpospora phusangensis]GIH25884.1 sulfotransferase family protein [Acrocarpospora phusangensis]
MKWKHKVNTTLEGLTGYTLKRSLLVAPRPPAPAPPPVLSTRAPGDVVRPPVDPAVDRLLAEPVFLLSSVRSGSTLLRVMLNSHSRIHAPHELHVRRLTVGLPTEPLRQAMEVLGHSQSDIEHILWDRMLHRELVKSGKDILVEKTPSNVFAWKRIRTCWPDARLIFLIRHPMSIAQSWHEADPEKRPMDEALRHTLNYMTYLEEARQKLPGLTVRYESLTQNPEVEVARICSFLGVAPEPGMLRYGTGGEDFVKGIGDWREKIRSGTVQHGRPLPAAEDVPETLHEMCRTWNYM